MLGHDGTLMEQRVILSLSMSLSRVKSQSEPYILLGMR